MAEIHVQTKKSSGNSMWIWIVLALVIIGAVVYYLMNRNKSANTATPPANTTGAIQHPVERISIQYLSNHTTAMHACASAILEPKALLS